MGNILILSAAIVGLGCLCWVILTRASWIHDWSVVVAMAATTGLVCLHTWSAVQGRPLGDAGRTAIGAGMWVVALFLVRYHLSLRHAPSPEDLLHRERIVQQQAARAQAAHQAAQEAYDRTQQAIAHLIQHLDEQAVELARMELLATQPGIRQRLQLLARIATETPLGWVLTDGAGNVRLSEGGQLREHVLAAVSRGQTFYAALPMQHVSGALLRGETVTAVFEAPNGSLFAAHTWPHDDGAGVVYLRLSPPTEQPDAHPDQ